MANTLSGIAVDCNDAATLARFWGAVLGRQVAAGATADSAVLLPGDQAISGPRLDPDLVCVGDRSVPRHRVPGSVGPGVIDDGPEAGRRGARQ